MAVWQRIPESKRYDEIIEGFKFAPVECNGAAIGMHGKGGGLLCKSWTIMTRFLFGHKVLFAAGV